MTSPLPGSGPLMFAAQPAELLAMLGFTFTGEKGDAVLRVEYLFAGGKTCALRSSPA